MRIMHAIEGVRAASGGTTSAFFNLLDATAADPRLRALACCPEPPPGDPSRARLDAAPDGRFHLTGPPGRLRPGPFGARLAALARDRAFDALHLHGMWSMDLVHAALAARRAGIPTLWQPHGMLIAEARNHRRLKKDLFMRLGLARALRQAAGFVCATPHEAETSLPPAGCEALPRHIVPLPVPIPDADRLGALREEGRARLGGGEAPRAVFLGRLHPVKRLELTLAALAHAPGLRLTVFGTGEPEYTQALQALARDLGVAERVHFAGWLDAEDRWALLAGADALVLNSVHENFGYVIAEAAACGTPVALTTNLSLADEARSAGFGMVAPPDPATLGAALAEAATPARRATLGVAGRRWAEATLSYRAVGARLAEIYASLPSPEIR